MSATGCGALAARANAVLEPAPSPGSGRPLTFCVRVRENLRNCRCERVASDHAAWRTATLVRHT
ncbi:hypothetical protein [Ornithinimicrobium kibberense]|uniref:hypothetical protein n=1 Tax=Ornithinimicrobium kibberense TaxID=282060 RepID=UPI003622D407